MSKMWTIARHEVFITMRRKGYLFMTFGVPIIAAVAVVVLLLIRGSDNGDQPENPLEDLDLVELHDAFTISDIQTYGDVGLTLRSGTGLYRVRGCLLHQPQHR